jgi:HEAT repeat protein
MLAALVALPVALATRACLRASLAGTTTGIVADLRDWDPEARFQAAKMVWTQKRTDRELVPALADLLHDKVAYISFEAAYALAKIASVRPEAVDVLLEALTDDSPIVRRNAARVMEHVPRSESVIGPLLTVLEDDDEEARHAAAVSLRVLKPSERVHLPPLIKAMRDESPKVRREIAAALGAFGAEARDVVPVLREALTDGDANVRGAAIRSLGEMGPKAREAADHKEREGGARALKRIDAQAAEKAGSE